MATSSENSDLGPLPRIDLQDVLQRRSISALHAVIPADTLIFREEPVVDKGVDGSLEAIVDSRATNCRAQVQLKSAERLDPNNDGSLSCQIETKNLNYLLNGPCPLYLLWVAQDQHFRFAWAHEEWHRLDVERPGWRDQETFTIRFRDVLTAEGWAAIHARILEHARFQRGMRERLARSSLSERVTVTIDPRTLDTSDPQQICDSLTSNGMTFVSSGLGQRVLELMRGLNAEALRIPRIQLVAAYAETTLGRYQAALGHLANAALQESTLSEDDQQFLGYLRGVCEYQTGLITNEQYLDQERRWAEQLNGPLAAIHRMESLRHERMSERDPQRRANLLQDMKRAADSILNSDRASEPQRLQTRIAILNAEGDECTGFFINAFAILQARRGMQLPVRSFGHQTAAAILSRWRQWQRDAQTVLKDALAAGHPLLLADAFTTQMIICVGYFETQRLMAVTDPDPWKLPPRILDTGRRNADQAIQLYDHAGNIEGTVRCRLLLADLLEMAGQTTEAQTIAREVLPIARAMRYQRLAELACEHIDGQTMFHRFRASSPLKKSS